jgi:adenosylcobinamide-phosphate synthase
MKELLWIGIAICVDILLGDPHWLPHPVVAVGKLISTLERFLRRRMKNLRKAGVVLGLAVILLTAGAAWLLSLIHPVVQIYLLYAALAPRCLHTEARKIRKTLENGTIEQARHQVSMLVGRETAQLNKEQIVKATVETVAENTTDGVISPLLYMLLGSLFGWAVPLVWAYKAVSTLDSMVGYKNEKYIDLGRFSARADDVFNFIPARITGVFMSTAAFFCGLNGRAAWRIMIRDHANHPSPNSAWSESAAAGALGLQLGGGAYYSGKWVEKKTQGDALKQAEPKDISRVSALMWATYGLVSAVFGGAVYILFRLGVF